jgi:hypothetical protein
VGEQGEYRRFSFPARSRCKKKDILSSHQGANSLGLRLPQIRPAKSADDVIAQCWM